jgi:hypothetical protein
VKSRTLFLSLAALVFVGCGDEPRIDGSSNVAFESSLKRVTETLDESEQADFQAAIHYLAKTRMSQDDIVNSSGWNPMEFQQFMINEIRNEIDGYTAAEVIDKAIALRNQKQ